MSATLQKYVPEHAVQSVFELIVAHEVHLKIVNERVTRHGDYRKGVSGKHEVTVNANLNKYRFLITLIHEIAHLVAFEKYGRYIKPHGDEWKMVFQRLMVPYIRPEIFRIAFCLWWPTILKTPQPVAIPTPDWPLP